MAKRLPCLRALLHVTSLGLPWGARPSAPSPLWSVLDTRVVLLSVLTSHFRIPDQEGLTFVTYQREHGSRRCSGLLEFAFCESSCVLSVKTLVERARFVFCSFVRPNMHSRCDLHAPPKVSSASCVPGSPAHHPRAAFPFPDESCPSLTECVCRKTQALERTKIWFAFQLLPLMAV